MGDFLQDGWEKFVPEGEWTEVKKKDRSKGKKIPAALPSFSRTRSPPVSPMKSPPATPAPTIPALVATPPVSATNMIFPTPAATAMTPASSSKGEKSEPSPPPLTTDHFPPLAVACNPMDKNPSWADQVDEDEAEEAAFRERMRAQEVVAATSLDADEGTYESEENDGDDTVMSTIAAFASSVEFGVVGVKGDEEGGYEGGSGDHCDEVDLRGCGAGSDHGGDGNHGVDKGHGDSDDQGDDQYRDDDEEQGEVDEFMGDREQEGEEHCENEEGYEQGGDNEGEDHSGGSDDNGSDGEHGVAEGHEEDENQVQDDDVVEDDHAQDTESPEAGADSETWNEEAEVLQVTDPYEEEEAFIDNQSEHEAQSEELEPEQVYDEENTASDQDELVTETAEDPQVITARLENMLRSSAKSLGKQPFQQDQKPDWMQLPEWDTSLPAPSSEIVRKPAPHLQATPPKLKSHGEKQKTIDSEGFQTVSSKARKTVTFAQEPYITSYDADTASAAGDAPTSPTLTAPAAPTGPPHAPRYVRAPEPKPAVPGALFVEEQSVPTPRKTRKRVKSKSRSKKPKPSALDYLGPPGKKEEPVPVAPESAEEMMEEEEEAVAAEVPQPVAVEQQAVVTHSKKKRKRGPRAKKRVLVGDGGEVEEEKGGSGEVQTRSAWDWLVDRPTYEIWAISGGSVMVLISFILALIDYFLK